MVVIEMNPRVSRSSALASKATGFPIAKIAAKLAVGYRLHELPNDITRKTRACFEPTIDYVVTKIPRFAFEKFPEADATLTTQMKSVGETMAIGRTFKESFQKALRGLEVGSFGFGCDGKDLWGTDRSTRAWRRSGPNWPRRTRNGSGTCATPSRAACPSGNLPPHRNRSLVLDQLSQIVEMEEELSQHRDLADVDAVTLRNAKRFGFSDRQLAKLWKTSELEIRQYRKSQGIVATFKSVDTCAAEFEAYTPYYYSTYEDEDETPPKEPGDRRIMILGGGPNRIGQGIEFDYCCCHASFALREIGIESIMVNSNPETVSTDYDTSDLLFFEPLTTEDVLNIFDRAATRRGHRTVWRSDAAEPARALQMAGVPIIGTSVDTIEKAEDREKFQQLLNRLGLKQPANGIARTMSEARSEAARIGFPSLVRPSFVLGGRAMEICYDQPQFERFVAEAFVVAQGQPVLIDRFLEDATEVDVDAISDGEDVVVAGIMEHIEEAGVHSGDSACVIPPYSLPGPVVQEIREATRVAGSPSEGRGPDERAVRRQERRWPDERLRAGGQPAGQPHGAVRGQSDRNARGQDRRQSDGRQEAGRTGRRSRADSRTRIDQGKRVSVPQVPRRRHCAGARNAQHWRGHGRQRTLLHRFREKPTRRGRYPAAQGEDLPQRLRSTQGPDRPTRQETGGPGILPDGHGRHRPEVGGGGDPGRALKKLAEGHPNLVDRLIDGEVALVINTPSGKGARTDEGKIRAKAVQYGVPCITTIQAAEAAVVAMEALRHEEMNVQALQDRLPGAAAQPGSPPRNAAV